MIVITFERPGQRKGESLVVSGNRKSVRNPGLGGLSYIALSGSSKDSVAGECYSEVSILLPGPTSYIQLSVSSRNRSVESNVIEWRLR